MTWVDYLFLAVLGGSVLLSFWRGAVREIFSLLGWVIAYFASVSLAPTVAPMLPSAIQPESWRLFAAYIVVAAVVVLAMTIAGIALSSMLKLVGLGVFDRAVGAVVGFGRGILIIILITLAAGLTPLPKSPAWRYAVFTPVFTAAGVAIKGYLPVSMARNLRFE